MNMFSVTKQDVSVLETRIDWSRWLYVNLARPSNRLAKCDEDLYHLRHRMSELYWISNVLILLNGCLPESFEFGSRFAVHQLAGARRYLEGGPWKMVSGFCKRAAEKRSTGM